MSLPASAKIRNNGHYEIGGVDVADLARQYGTPLYVLDEVTLRNQCRAYVDSFHQAYPNSEIAFASKALCTLGVAKIASDEGLGFDVSSGGELFTVLKAGADPKKIYFHGNNKTLKEIEEGIKAKVGYFMVDNLAELQNIENLAAGLGQQVEIMIRINPGIEAHTHDFIQTGKIDSKFGVPLDMLDDFILQVKAMKQLKLVGFHSHIGSQILDITPFIEEVKLLLDLTLKHGTQVIGLGGGIGISYLPDQSAPQISDFAQKIGAILKGKTTAKLTLEPGRSIVGQAGVTLYTVGAVKKIPGIRTYAIVDGGMADNPRPILYEAQYEVFQATQALAQPAEVVTVAGRYCESGDMLVRDVKMPRLNVGDLLMVSCTGAYNYSMASNYNRVPRPAMVLVNQGGSKLLVKRESY